MNGPVYYNENAAHPAGWLRNLVAAGLIPAGDVDERDIRDVRPGDLAGYTQCHFFAGIGLWPYALALAGWPQDRPVWTGSCPCQPFSAAGHRKGFADERHLWPAWHWLISQCRPGVIFGEQVASAHGLAWFDLVSTDLEADGYACGPVAFPSCGLGAPNIRHRLWWVADAHGDGRDIEQRVCGQQAPSRLGRDQPANGLDPGGLADPKGGGRGVDGLLRQAVRGRQDPGQSALGDEAADRLGNPCDARLPHTEPHRLEGSRWGAEGRAVEQPGGAFAPWRELEWLDCTDGRRRPTQPGIFPLAARHPGDVAKLRAIGNAINPLVAAEIIASYLDRA